MTAIATMLTGTLAGFVLVGKTGETASRYRRAAAALALWGAAGIAAGLAWSRWLPINKNLWTGSYVVFTSGAACVALAVSIVVVDLKGWLSPRGIFFTFGRNPLVVFVGSGLLAKSLGLVKLAGPGGRTVSLQRVLYDGGFSWIADPTLRSHAFAVVTILFWWGILLVFERKGWYWKV